MPRSISGSHVRKAFQGAKPGRSLYVILDFPASALRCPFVRHPHVDEDAATPAGLHKTPSKLDNLAHRVPFGFYLVADW